MMGNAPERIWAVTEPDDISAQIMGAVYAQQVPDGMVGCPVEYVRADLAAPSWQPIETCPPEHVLFHGNTRHDCRVVFTGWKAVNGRFYADTGDSVNPTHWMPLPAPPEAD